MPYQKSGRHFSRDIRQNHRLNLVFNIDFLMTIKETSSLSRKIDDFSRHAPKKRRLFRENRLDGVATS